MQAAAVTIPPETVRPSPTPERVVSVDAFRGLTMILMLSEGFGLTLLASARPDLGWLQPIANQFRHEPWVGLRVWDMIQPAFMFLVGTSMPFAFGRRWAAGEPWGDSLRRVLKRCALLILWGLVARSVQAGRPTLDLINVLAQISFTYLVTFLVLRKSWEVQLGTALGLLAAHWALYQFATAPGVQGPWVRDANIGWWLDRTLLGKNWGGSYATLNCVSSAANTIFGMMAGYWLLAKMPAPRRLRGLLLSGLVAIAVGLALAPWIPVIKKIWTPSFALISTGLTLWTLALFHVLCDLKQQPRWAKPLLMVGANSIFIYLFHEILHRWLIQTGYVFTGWTQWLWGDLGKAINVCVVLAFEIYVCAWLYRRKLYFKL